MNLFRVVLNVALLVVATTSFCICQLSALYLTKRKDLLPTRQWHLAILIVLLLPEVTSLVAIIWKTPFLANGNLKKWPRPMSLFMGIFSSILEITCIGLMTLNVAPRLPVYCYFPLLNTIMLGKMLVDVLHEREVDINSDEEITGKKSCGNTSVLKVFKIAVILVAAGITITLVTMLRVYKILNDFTCVLLVLGLAILAVVWLPFVRKFTFKPCSINDLVYKNNASLLYSTLKVAGYCLLVMLVFQYETDYNTLTGIFETDNYDFDFTSLILIIVYCVGVVLCNGLKSLSTKLCCNYVVLNGACFLSGPIIIGLSVYLSIAGSVFVELHGGVWDFTTEIFPYIIVVLSFLLWLLPFVVYKLKLFTDNFYLLVPSEQLFTSFSVNPFFLTQHLFVNYTPQCVAEMFSQSDQVHGDKPTTIYICTTMYREAEYEMRRLLISLRKLSLSEEIRNENVCIETHIFLDGGADGGRLKEFALQLLSLVTETLKVDVPDGTGCQTPYGLQMLWTVPGGMQIFFHFKDIKKVKAKKRWSQVMYINYIIEHRTKIAYSKTNQNNKSQNVPKIHDITITVTDEHGNTTEDTTDTDRNLFYLTKDALSVYSETTSVNDSLSNFSDGTDDNNLNLSLSRIESCLTLGGDLSRSSSFASIPDLNVYRESLKHKKDEEKQDYSATQDIPSISSQVQSTESSQMELDERSYILATDADMGFEPEAVLSAMRLANENLGIGGVCGMTHPVGKHQSPLVWNQMFEYCKDFWTTKSSQNVIGSVQCCPGCFSLYRLSALAEVMSEYASPTFDEFGVFTKDTGEDRWMCTLMMMRGWKLKYSHAARNTTYCPDSFVEFMKQRRRWILSDVANTLIVMKNLRHLISQNSSFSLVFITSLIHLFLLSFLAPASSVAMMAISFDYIFGIQVYITGTILLVLLIAFIMICVSNFKAKTVEQVTKWFMLLMIVPGSIAIIGAGYFVTSDILKDIREETFQFEEHFAIFSLTSALVFAAIIHTKDAWLLLLGIVHLIFFPVMYMVLPVYTICHVVDQSWGTREDQKPKIPKSIHLPKMKKKLKIRKKKMKKHSNMTYLTEDDVSSVFQMEGEDRSQDEQEYNFWVSLGERLIGPSVNCGTSKTEMAKLLHSLRNRAIVLYMTINLAWGVVLCLAYVFFLSPSGGITTMGVLFLAIYGYSLLIQIIGMTVCRINDLITICARALRDENYSIWVKSRES